MSISHLEVTFTCPLCGEEIRKTLGELEGKNSFSCPRIECEATFRPDDMSAVKDVEESLGRLSKIFGE